MLFGYCFNKLMLCRICFIWVNFWLMKVFNCVSGNFGWVVVSFVKSLVKICLVLLILGKVFWLLMVFLIIVIRWLVILVGVERMVVICFCLVLFFRILVICRKCFVFVIDVLLNFNICMVVISLFLVEKKSLYC